MSSERIDTKTEEDNGKTERRTGVLNSACYGGKSLKEHSSLVI
jgi:hypothetical protein